MSSEEKKNDFENKLEKHIMRSIESGISSVNGLIPNRSREEVQQAFKALEAKCGFHLVELDYEDIIILKEEVFSNDEIRIVRFCSENEEWRFDNESAVKRFLDGFSNKFVIIVHPDGHSDNIRLNDYAYHLLNDDTSILLVYGIQGHYSSRYRRFLLDFLREKKNDGKRLVKFLKAFVLLNPPFDNADLYQIQVADGKDQFLFVQ